MTAHKEVGTLAEIGAKVGDVVKFIYNRFEVICINQGSNKPYRLKCIENGIVDTWYCDDPSWRIISRAAPDYMDGNWHDWQGGECPVPGDVRVEVTYEGEDHRNNADAYDWSGQEVLPTSHITRFRVIRDVGAPSVSSAPSPHETPTCPLHGPYTARETLFLILGAHSASPFLPGWLEAQIRDTVGRAV